MQILNRTKILAMTTKNKAAINQIYNTAVGDRTNLFELVNYLKKYLAYFDEKIKEVKVKYGPSRKGDIPHSLASIEKSQKLLLYTPSHFIENGLKESIKYYHREKK